MSSGYVHAEGSHGSFEVPNISDEIDDYKSDPRPDKTDPLYNKKCIISGGGCNFSISENPKADGSASWYEFDFMSQVEDHASTIDKVAKETGVDARLVRAIMYVETTHGWYDIPLPWFDANKSILPMNINFDYWGEDAFGSRDDLKDSYKNIKAGALMIKSI